MRSDRFARAETTGSGMIPQATAKKKDASESRRVRSLIEVR
jgi:hypothetical protein